MSPRLKLLLILAGLLIIGALWSATKQSPPESRNNNNNYQEDSDLAANDKIKVFSPLPNGVISSPVSVRGEARGNWYFEASFPIRLEDAGGKQIAETFAMANPLAGGDWMTENFVPFEVSLSFPLPETDTGFLVLEKDNPSDLPEHADELRIPVRFK